MAEHYKQDDNGNFIIALADGGVVTINTSTAFGAEYLQAGTLQTNALMMGGVVGKIEVGTQLKCPGDADNQI